jgi:hypothetical protein
MAIVVRAMKKFAVNGVEFGPRTGLGHKLTLVT